MRNGYKPGSILRVCIGQRSFSLLYMLLVATSLAGARPSDTPSVQAMSASTSITLDGHLDEPAWREAPVLKLVQQSPKPEEPTPYETEVRVLVTRDHIYFSFVCKDPNPRRIAVHTMQRDQNSEDAKGATRSALSSTRTATIAPGTSSGSMLRVLARTK
jgi:hypothetical protein